MRFISYGSTRGKTFGVYRIEIEYPTFNITRTSIYKEGEDIMEWCLSFNHYGSKEKIEAFYRNIRCKDDLIRVLSDEGL